MLQFIQIVHKVQNLHLRRRWCHHFHDHFHNHLLCTVRRSHPPMRLSIGGHWSHWNVHCLKLVGLEEFRYSLSCCDVLTHPPCLAVVLGKVRLTVLGKLRRFLQPCFLKTFHNASRIFRAGVLFSGWLPVGARNLKGVSDSSCTTATPSLIFGTGAQNFGT